MYYLLETGMLIWHAETAQDLYDWILGGFMVAEQPDVHLPLALCCDGFFVTHTKDTIMMQPDDMCLPPYDSLPKVAVATNSWYSGGMMSASASDI